MITLVTILTMTSAAYGETLADLKKKQDSIKSDTKNIQQQLTDTQQQQSTVIKAIDAFDAEMDKANEELDVLTDQLDQSQAKLEATQKELAAAEEDKNVKLEALQKRAKFIYQSGETGYIEAILNADSFNDLLNRAEYINRIVSYDQGLVAKFQAAEDLEAQKVERVKQQKDSIQVLADQQKSKMDSLQVLMDDKERHLETLKSDEAKYTQKLSDLDASDKAIEKLIQERVAAAARQNISKSMGIAAYTGGKLGFPAPSNRTGISSPYGYRSSPICGKKEFHSGVDIPSPYGTNIVAAESGVVIFAGRQNGYGNVVIIDHGGGLSTMYGHASKNVVSVGQSVAKGQTIQKAGSTGYSTGSHVHFEVRVNGKTTNPMNYFKG